MAKTTVPAQPVLADLLGFQLRRVSAQSMAELEKSLADLDLRTIHYTVLATVTSHPRITQNDICRAIHVRPANLVPIVRELVDRELIVRRPDPTDKRIVRISLAPAGEALISELHRRVLEHEDRYLQPLSADERASLMRLLMRLGTSPD